MRIKWQYLFFVLCIVYTINLEKAAAMSRALQQNKVYIENLLPKGYVKDGSIDYTSAIQKVLNDYNYVVFPDFPLLLNDAGLKVKSNSVLEFRENSLLILKGSNKDTYNIIEIHDVENVQILNVKIKGDRETHIGKNGEHGMGIGIRSAKNIKIVNARIEDCWGDGIYIGRLNKYDKLGMFIPSENVKVQNTYLNRNRRNALTLTAGKNISIDGLEANSTQGTFPMAGIDIEPNSNKDYLEGIVFNNISTNNNRYGVQICLKKMVGVRQGKVDIRIENHVDKKSQIAFRVDKFDRPGKPLAGQIEVVNATWEDNNRGHLSFAGSQNESCNIIFVNTTAKKNGVILKENFKNESGKSNILESIEKRAVFRK